MEELTLEMNVERCDIPQDKQREEGIMEEGIYVQNHRCEIACQGPGPASSSKS